MSMKYRIQLKYSPAEMIKIALAALYAIHPTVQIANTCREWCKETIGTNGWNYYGMYRKIPYEFRFKREEDLLAFKLRFGEHCVIDDDNNIT